MSESDGEPIAFASPPLAYATPTHGSPRFILYRIAQACWLLPLVIGVGSLFLYVLTSNRSLPGFGVLTILASVGLFAIATVCLAAFKTGLERCTPDVRHTWHRRSNSLVVLLVLNVPIALACTFAGVWLMHRHTVVVVNSTSSPIQEVSIIATRHQTKFGDIPANGRVSKTLTVTGEGSIDFMATQNGSQVSGSAGGYLDGTTNRGTTTITFTPSGIVTQSRP